MKAHERLEAETIVNSVVRRKLECLPAKAQSEVRGESSRDNISCM